MVLERNVVVEERPNVVASKLTIYKKIEYK
jgi:hypothetical protein